MATIHITLSIHHRGQFERRPCAKVTYIGGEVTEIERVNVDTFNGFFISDLLKDIGYMSIAEFYWQELGKELDNGLRLLRIDMDVVKMYEAAMKNGNKINVYTEHPVDHLVLVEEKEMTPSKMRRKSCAKRVPTPKKSPRRRLLVVEDDDDAEIAGPKRGEAQQENNPADVDAQNKDSFTVPQQIPNPVPSISHEVRQISQPPLTPVLLDEPPSTQSQPFQPPVEHDQQSSHTHGTDAVPPSEANVSEASQPPIEHDQ
ncbi:hypothetical protein Ahy_B04g069645 [Arachis hypogaea]|uniref:PB1-like domain-containing protein n=1 Tax=Arachis hypogaea TaxID=3818 RepID=A0A444ZD62_ARAHY|nr:hypothetical protein Ahy_B04g069645 [Arachis hypogaea]